MMLHQYNPGGALKPLSKRGLLQTAVPQIIPGGMDRKHLAETRREPIRGGSTSTSLRLTVSARCFRSMPLIFVGQQWLLHALALSYCGNFSVAHGLKDVFIKPHFYIFVLIA